LKCNDCQNHDGIFQCYHCNQQLCIRCCNKHHKKITYDVKHVNQLTDKLLAKIIQTKQFFEQEKNQTIEQCHQWHIETINTINRAHQLMIQTIHREYEALCKDYDDFMKKQASIDVQKERINFLTKQINEIDNCSFRIQLPKFEIDDKLRVESSFGENTRSTSVIWQDESINNDDQHDSTYSSASSQDDLTLNRRKKSLQSFALRRKTTPLTNFNGYANHSPWLIYKTHSISSLFSTDQQKK